MLKTTHVDGIWSKITTDVWYKVVDEIRNKVGLMDANTWEMLRNAVTGPTRFAENA